MTVEHVQQILDNRWPSQFEAQAVGGTQTTRVRRKGPGLDFKTEDIVGTYDLQDESLTPDMIREDIEAFLESQKD